MSFDSAAVLSAATFFAGTAFSNTDRTARIERVVAPTRDFFAAVFFFSIGLAADVTLLPDVSWLLATAVVLTAAGKLVSGTVSGRLYGLDRRRSIRVGIGLVPRAEFSLVVATLAASTGTGALGSVVPAFTVGYVLIMSVLGTVLVQNADRITRRLSPPSREAPPGSAP